MDPASMTAFAKALAMLGDIALIVVAPVMVWNSIKLIKLDIMFSQHVLWAKDTTQHIESRLNAHAIKIDDLIQKRP